MVAAVTLARRPARTPGVGLASIFRQTATTAALAATAVPRQLPAVVGSVFALILLTRSAKHLRSRLRAVNQSASISKPMTTIAAIAIMFVP